MKVVFVTPRYGAQIPGGAETAARHLAEHLVADLGWDVDAYSTCALSAITWDNELPAGTYLENGVKVQRFKVERGRDPEFYKLDERIRLAPRHVSLRQAQCWVELNGPVTPQLVEALSDSRADAAIFYPYMYYPTTEGILRAPMAKVLHPAAHDEPALYLRVFSATYAAADGICYHTAAERRLVQRVYQVADRPQIVLGAGVATPSGDGRRGADILGIGERPYIVTVGRVDSQKGASMLAAFFRLYKERNPGPLALALVGPVSSQIPPHPDVILTAAVDEATKWDLLKDATAFVSPSALESFSLVIMEAWLQQIPVLVNAACPPTREHAVLSGGGLWFGSYRQFEASLNRLLADADLRRVLGARGKAYVENNYDWPVLIERYASFLEKVA